MKKIFLYLIFILFLMSCSNVYYSKSLEKYNLTKKENVFIGKFITAVENHNSDKFIKLLDKDYKKEQFYGMYNGNLNNFLNDFFCGYNSNKKYYCINFFNIQKIFVVKVKQYDDKNKQIIFRVQGNGKDILVDLLLNEDKLGFIGSYG